ncbi:hypothetical protein JKP88DRAFT_307244 [Tribonema minus]|uniref:Uncharacterized protein n=1 Tax=Tribonema minus TaxID=303371 RepID=A0A835ZC51_9STRA|nr:hypothetical protein JKP88DRAFT_307244 [Tribonema minus]
MSLQRSSDLKVLRVVMAEAMRDGDTALLAKLTMDVLAQMQRIADGCHSPTKPSGAKSLSQAPVTASVESNEETGALRRRAAHAEAALRTETAARQRAQAQLAERDQRLSAETLARWRAQLALSEKDEASRAALRDAAAARQRVEKQLAEKEKELQTERAENAEEEEDLEQQVAKAKAETQKQTKTIMAYVRDLRKTHRQELAALQLSVDAKTAQLADTDNKATALKQQVTTLKQLVAELSAQQRSDDRPASGPACVPDCSAVAAAAAAAGAAAAVTGAAAAPAATKKKAGKGKARKRRCEAAAQRVCAGAAAAGPSAVSVQSVPASTFVPLPLFWWL